MIGWSGTLSLPPDRVMGSPAGGTTGALDIGPGVYREAGGDVCLTIRLDGMTAQPNPARRERILHEGQQLFFAQGLRGVSMDEVASAAGVKKANVFHYFPSKEALELAVLERFSSDLRERLAAQFAATGDDPIDAVARMFEEAA